MLSKSAVIAAFIAAAASVNATGNAIVKNHCSFPIYMWTVLGSNAPSEMQTLGSGESYSESYQTGAANGGGMSMKLSKSAGDMTDIMQLEYTFDTGEFAGVYYDLSMINGNPFMQWGEKIVASDSSCPTVHCAAGIDPCPYAYNLPDDNEATHSCPNLEADTTLIMCPGEHHSGATNVQEDAVKPHHHHHHHSHHKHAHHHHHHHEHKEHKKHHHAHKASPADPNLATWVQTDVATVVTAPAATTFVTQVVTVTAEMKKREAKATPPPQI